MKQFVYLVVGLFLLSGKLNRLLFSFTFSSFFFLARLVYTPWSQNAFVHFFIKTFFFNSFNLERYNKCLTIYSFYFTVAFTQAFALEDNVEQVDIDLGSSREGSRTGNVPFVF